MSTREAITRQLNELPEDALEEVRDYLEFLKSRTLRHKSATAIASEPALARDWLRPEEDAAWVDL